MQRIVLSLIVYLAASVVFAQTPTRVGLLVDERPGALARVEADELIEICRAAFEV